MIVSYSVWCSRGGSLLLVASPLIYLHTGNGGHWQQRFHRVHIRKA